MKIIGRNALLIGVALVTGLTSTGATAKSAPTPAPIAKEKKMVNLGLYVRLEAKPGKEAALDAFLRSALPLAQAERGTPVWYAIRFGPSTFAIFDAFTTEEDRSTHLNGPIAAALMQHADELLATPPVIERWDTLAVK